MESRPVSGPSEQHPGVVPASSGAPPANPPGTAGPSNSNAATHPSRPQMPHNAPVASPTRPPRPPMLLPPLSGPYSPARPPLLPGPAQRPLTSQAPNQPTRPIMSPPSRRRASRPSSGVLKKHCNCKNSRCLKLYCECFASGRYCDNCNCVNCCNNHEHETTRQAAVEGILERNPNAFRPKIQATDDVLASSVQARHNKGCNCKKSGCLKKYCECFQAGIVCSDICKCVDCKNFEGSEARAAIIFTQEASRAQPMSPAQKRYRTAPRVFSPSPYSPASSPTQAGLAAAPSGYAGPPRPVQGGGVPYRPASAHGPVSAATFAYRNQFSEALRRGVAEEVCRLLLLVSQEEGALLARQHPGLLGPAAPIGGASSSSPATAPAVAGGIGPDAAAQAAPAASTVAVSAAAPQFSLPAHLPMAPGPLPNGPGHVASTVSQQQAAQTAASVQPMPVSAAAAAGPSGQSPAAPVLRSPQATTPGVAVNGAYQRAIQAANQQAAADVYAAQERAVLKEYHVILKKIMNQVQTRAALQMQAAAQMGATMGGGGYRPPAGSLPAMAQPQQQQQYAQQFPQHGVPGVGLPAMPGAAAPAAMANTPTGPYAMQPQGLPMPLAGAGYSPVLHGGGPPPPGPHIVSGQGGGLAGMPVQQPMLQPPDDAPMVTFKEEPTSSNAAG